MPPLAQFLRDLEVLGLLLLLFLRGKAFLFLCVPRVVGGEAVPFRSQIGVLRGEAFLS